MGKSTVFVVSALLSVFSLSSFAKTPFEKISELSNRPLEQLASGFEIIREDLTSPFNGMWAYVSRTKFSPPVFNSEIISTVVYSEICNLLKRCPEKVFVDANTQNDPDRIVNAAAAFLFQLAEKELESKRKEFGIRARILRTLRSLVKNAFEDQVSASFTGTHRSGNRDGSFAAFYDEQTGELLVLGSNSRP